MANVKGNFSMDPDVKRGIGTLAPVARTMNQIGGSFNEYNIHQHATRSEASEKTQRRDPDVHHD